ncbi:flavin reductase family protein [candidate division TA06 bacterium]|nr:flavin reductase family protein [candidate division TA06 bacterium]
MDPEAKKKALRMISYGLYVLTTKYEDEITAGTVNWLSQASFEPPIVMVGIKKDSSLHRLIKKSNTFAVHILGKDQKKFAQNFFKPSKVEGNKISGAPFEIGKSGSPLLLDPPAFFECNVIASIERGDHTVFVNEVIEAGVRREEEPLAMRDTGWSYGG